MPGTHGPGCGCKHETEFLGAEFLLPYIDKDAIRGYNEKIHGTAKTVFKAFENRLDESQFCDSEEYDPELIITVPFISPCKVSSFHVIGGDDLTHPTTVKLYINQDNIDFSSVQDTSPMQEFQLIKDFHGAVEYPVKTAKFANVSTLSFYFSGNEGGDWSRIFYIGIRGQGSNLKRSAVVTVYEAQPNVSDHEVRGDTFTPHFGL